MSSEDYSGSITTAVRIRPFSQKEIETEGNKKAIDCSNPGKVLCLKTGSPALSFPADFVFNDTTPVVPNESQKEIYETLAIPLLKKALLGYNACLFAYGVTSSGKTYSMYGTPSNPGIVPRFVEDLFDCIRVRKGTTASISIKFSYFEIYNEKIYDLLQDKNSAPKLKVREDPLEGPYVQGLVQPAVHSPEEVFDWLRRGDARRRVAATEWNTHSSRSHTIASFHFTKRELASFSKKATVENVITSKLNLVDLAGSERQSSNSSAGERLAEACQINKSLFTLGRVIYQLSGDQPLGLGTPAATPFSSKRKQNSYVSYRDSVLTWILKDSLGGNSVTTMLATVSPSSLRIDDTVSTLQHVIRAQRIVNQAKVNEDPSGVIIRELKAQVERLQRCRKEASAPKSPLSGQIKTLENLLKTREKEVAYLTKELTERTLDCERLRAEARLHLEFLPQPLFAENMDPGTLSETPIKGARSCDERDSGAYSDIARPLPEGSEKSDSALQIDKINTSGMDSFSNTVLAEATTVAAIEDMRDKEAFTNTDELFQLVPLADYDFQKFETYRDVRKVSTSIEVNEGNFGFCVLPTKQLSALKDIIRLKFGAIHSKADANDSIGQIASLESELKVLYGVNKCATGTSSHDLGYHVVSETKFKRLIEDLSNAYRRIYELESERQEKLSTLVEVGTNTPADLELLYTSVPKAFKERTQHLESTLPTFVNISGSSDLNCSVDLDLETLTRTEFRRLDEETNFVNDKLAVIKSKECTSIASSTTLQSKVPSVFEVEVLKPNEVLGEQSILFKNTGKCDAATSSLDLDRETPPETTLEEIFEESKEPWDPITVIGTNKYDGSAVQANKESVVPLCSELAALEDEMRCLKFKLEALKNVENYEVATGSADLDCKVVDKITFHQTNKEANEIPDRLGALNDKTHADSLTLTDDSVETVSRSELATLREHIKDLDSLVRAYASVRRCDASTSSVDLDYEILPRSTYEQIVDEGIKMHHRLSLIDAKKFRDSAISTEEQLEMIPVSKLSEMWVQIQSFSSKLQALTGIEKRESSASSGLHLAVLPKSSFEVISWKLKEANAQLDVFNAKSFINVASLTEEVEVLSLTEFVAIKERLQLLDSQLKALSDVKLNSSESCTDGDCDSLTTSGFEQIINFVNRMRDRLAGFEGRVFTDVGTEIDDYDLGVTLISTNFFNELYQRQYQLREKLSSLDPKLKSMDSDVSHKSVCNFDALLGRIDELIARVEMHGIAVENVEKSIVTDELPAEQSVHKHKESTKEGFSQLPISTNNIASDIEPEFRATRVLGTMPRRMDEHILNKVKFFESLQAHVYPTQTLDVVASSRALKRFRHEAIFDKENDPPGKEHKSTQTYIGRVRCGKSGDDIDLLQYRMSLQSWNLEYLEKENKQLAMDCKTLAEMLMKLIRSHRKTPPAYVISILDDVKKTLNQVSGDMQRDLRTASAPEKIDFSTCDRYSPPPS